MMLKVLLACVLILCVTGQLQKKEEERFPGKKDEVIDLPGLDPTQAKFRQYSGYLRATPTRFLHYW